MTRASSIPLKQHPTLTPPPPTSPHSILTLPPEIHLLITTYLNYPDALSLKHSHPYFYGIVDTGVRLKVDWLIERHRLRLDFPNEGQCVLKTDAAFCNGQVSRLMERRRRHEECAEGRCVVGGIEGCRRRGGRGMVWGRDTASLTLWKEWRRSRRRARKEIRRQVAECGWGHVFFALWVVGLWFVLAPGRGQRRECEVCGGGSEHHEDRPWYAMLLTLVFFGACKYILGSR